MANGSSKAGRIGLIGMPNCGKTAFLHALRLHGTSMPGWRLHLPRPRPDQLTADDYYSQLTRDGERWSNTLLGQVREFALFEVSRRGGRSLLDALSRSRRMEVTVPDPSGEMVKILAGDVIPESEEVSAHAEAFGELLRSCGGLLCLLDASLDQTEFARHVQRLQTVLKKVIPARDGSAGPLYVSWALTKCDADALGPLGRDEFSVTAASSLLLARAARAGIDPETLGVRIEHDVVHVSIGTTAPRLEADLALASALAQDFVHATFPNSGLIEELALLSQDGGAHAELFLLSSWGKELEAGTVPERNQIEPLRVTDPLRCLLEQIHADRSARASVSLSARCAALSLAAVGALAGPAALHRQDLADVLQTMDDAGGNERIQAALRTARDRNGEGLLGAHAHCDAVAASLEHAIERLEEVGLEDAMFRARWHSTAWLESPDFRGDDEFAPLRRRARDAWLRRFSSAAGEPERCERLLELASGRLTCDAAVHGALSGAMHATARSAGDPGESAATGSMRSAPRWIQRLSRTAESEAPPITLRTRTEADEQRDRQLVRLATSLSRDARTPWQRLRADYVAAANADVQRLIEELDRIDRFDPTRNEPGRDEGAALRRGADWCAEVLTDPQRRDRLTPRVHARLFELDRARRSGANEPAAANVYATELLRRLHDHDPERFPFEVVELDPRLEDCRASLEAAETLAALATAIDDAAQLAMTRPLGGAGKSAIEHQALASLRRLLETPQQPASVLDAPRGVTAWRMRLRNWPLGKRAAAGSELDASHYSADLLWFDAVLALFDPEIATPARAAFAQIDRTVAVLRDPPWPLATWLTIRAFASADGTALRRIDEELAERFVPANRPAVLDGFDAAEREWFAGLLVVPHGTPTLAAMWDRCDADHQGAFLTLLTSALLDASTEPRDPATATDLRAALLALVATSASGSPRVEPDSLRQLAKRAGGPVFQAWRTARVDETLHREGGEAEQRVQALRDLLAEFEDASRFAQVVEQRLLAGPSVGAAILVAWLAELQELQPIRRALQGSALAQFASPPAREQLVLHPHWQAYLRSVLPSQEGSLAHHAATWFLRDELELGAGSFQALCDKLRSAPIEPIRRLAMIELRASIEANRRPAEQILERGQPDERQRALELLDGLGDDAADRIRSHWLRLRSRGADLAVIETREGVSLLARRELTVSAYRQLIAEHPELAIIGANARELSIDAATCSGNPLAYAQLDGAARDALPLAGLPSERALAAAAALGGRLPTADEYRTAIAGLDADALFERLADDDGQVDYREWSGLALPIRSRDVTADTRIEGLFHGVREWVTSGGQVLLIGCSFRPGTQDRAARGTYLDPEPPPPSARYDAGLRVAYDLLPEDLD